MARGVNFLSHRRILLVSHKLCPFLFPILPTVFQTHGLVEDGMPWCRVGVDVEIAYALELQVGENASIGWNVSMYDTNFHPLGDAYTGKELCKMTSPIVIGKNNWIASDCHISKGFKTADDVVIAAGTNCLSRIRMKDQSLIGEKSPCEVLVEGVYKMF